MAEASSPPTAWSRLLTALGFLTRLPVGQRHGGMPLAEAAGCFPLAGAAVGAIGALAFWLAGSLGLPPTIAAVVAVGATLLATGALHEDGLADVADGFGGGFGRERKLEIMRDSRLGSYGALALMASFGLRTLALTSLASLDLVAAALVAGHAAARAPLPAVMAWSRPARAEGLGAAAGRPSEKQVWLGLGLGAGIALLALGPGVALPALLIAWAAAAFLTAVARRQIGGYTGDVLGAVEQVAETAFLLTLVSLL